jgi:CBS domain-containing protein
MTTARSMGEIVHEQNPLVLPPEATVAEACRAMHARRVGCVLVAGPDRTLQGVFTGRDAVKLLGTSGADPRALSLAQVMTRQPATLARRAAAIEALRLMEDGGFRHIPVVEDGRVVGVVSRYDFRAKEYGRLDTETGLWERI